MSRQRTNRVIPPSRVLLHERDSESGAYPTIARTGDVNRSGKIRTWFNDLSTLVFSDDKADVVYPIKLQYADATTIRGRNKEVTLATDATHAFQTSELQHGGGILATGSIVKGVSDLYIGDMKNTVFTADVNDQLNSTDPDVLELNKLGINKFQTITPFIEDRLFAIESASYGDPFYVTGSSGLDVGTTLFDGSLRQKTKITIQLPANDQLQITNEDNADSTGTIIRLMSYYNFDTHSWDQTGNKVWSMIGGPTNTQIAQFFENATIGFGTGYGLPLSGSSLAGLPTTTFGFPTHPKFHATKNQTLDVGSLISHPFLLEKIVLKSTIGFFDSFYLITPPTYVDSQLRYYDASEVKKTSNSAAAVLPTFFMLNQRKPINSFHVTNVEWDLYDNIGSAPTRRRTAMTSSIPSYYQLTSPGPSETYVDTTRDLVTWLQFCFYSGSQEPKAGMSGLSIDQLIKASGLTRDANYNISDQTEVWKASTAYAVPADTIAFAQSELVASASCRVCGYHETEGHTNTTNSTANVAAIRLTNDPGGRTGIRGPEQTGREYLTAAVPGGQLTQRLVRNNQSASLAGDTYRASQEIVINSPYLLLPGDQLVFGWQAPLPHDWTQLDNAGYIFFVGGFEKSDVVTLYGSLIKDAKEYHETLNTDLSSCAVHEVIHDGPVVDQFDVYPLTSLSGTYTDDIVEGLMYNSDLEVATTLDTLPRQRIGSNTWKLSYAQLLAKYASLRKASRLHGSGSSMQKKSRNVTLKCMNERYYDSLFPDVNRIAKINGVNIYYDVTGPWPNLDVGIYPLELGSGYDVTWRHSFPFEQRYDSVPRMIDPLRGLTITHELASASAVSPRRAKAPLFVWSGGTSNPGVTPQFTDYDTTYGAVTLQDKEENLKLFYGFGDGTYSATNQQGIPMGELEGAWGPVSCTVRGAKYGLANVKPVNTSVVFRRNRFGQFRDMLEQRSFSKFFNEISDQSLGLLRGPTIEPVTARFVNRKTGQAVKPNRTWSSNQSNYVTSSRPYFDNENPSNREFPVNLTLIPGATL